MVIPSLAGGGAERVCHLLANYWVRQGRTVWLVMLNAEGPFLSRLDNRVNVVAMGRTRTRQVPAKLAKFFREKPELPVLVFGFEFGVIISLLKLLRVVDNPVVYREGSDPNAQVGPTRRWLYGFSFPWIDGVLVQSSYAQRRLLSLGLNVPMQKVFNPIASVLAKAATPYAASFATAGRLVEGKGFHYLIEGFSRYVRCAPGARLIIAGVGPELARLQAQVRTLGIDKNVRFLGFVEDMSLVYQQADFFALPSRYEGQPNALLEALLAGCRVIAAGGEPVRDLLSGLDLPECWLPAEEFAVAFPTRIDEILALPTDRWRSAQIRLAAGTELGGVASAYWRFISALNQDHKVI